MQQRVRKNKSVTRLRTTNYAFGLYMIQVTTSMNIQSITLNDYPLLLFILTGMEKVSGLRLHTIKGGLLIALGYYTLLVAHIVMILL